MKKIFSPIIFLSFLFLIFGIYTSLFQIKLFDNYETRSHPFFHDYRGVTHSVTSRTKGSQSPEQIILSAKEAKLDYLFFTDLNTFSNQNSLNGYHGDVLAFTHPKISFREGHIISLSETGGSQFSQLIQWQNQLDILSDFGQNQTIGKPKDNFFILAHPFKRNMTWKSKIPSFIDGIEVINLRKLWQDLWYSEPLHFFHSIFVYPFNPKIALTRLIVHEDREFQLWDKVNKERNVIGLLGNQTTSRLFSVFGIGFSFPSYKESFQFASNHLLMESELTGNVESDRRKIFSSLKKGEFYFSFDSLGSPKGFAAFVKKQGRYFLPGNTIPLTKETTLRVELPSSISVPVEIRLFQNGNQVATSQEDKVSFKIESSGNYRIEVYVQPKLPFPESSRWLPWIFTNHFYFK